MSLTKWLKAEQLHDSDKKDNLNGRATRSQRRERSWERGGKHLLLISPFEQKRESRYLMLMLFLMLMLH